MALLKGFRFYTDTETTGLDAKKNQILTLDYLIKSEDTGKVEAEGGFKLLLKPGKPISPYALRLTNLNPFSKHWKSEAISETAMIEKLQKISAKNTVGNNQEGIIRPKFTAYNARFDRSFIAIAQNRSGYRFQDTFNKSITDPLKTARGLLKAGVIQTNDKKSAKLSAVCAAMGIELKDAHTSRADNLAQAAVHEKSFEMITGKSFYDTNTIVHDSLFEGEIYSVTTNSASSGIKKRSLLILKNLSDEGKIVALDSDSINKMMKDGGIKDTKKSKAYFDKVVREFNYSTILEENISKDEDIDLLTQFAEDHKEALSEMLKEREEQIQKRELSQSNYLFDTDVYDIDLIQGFEGVVSSGEITLEEAREALLEEGLDAMSAAAIVTKAHEYNLSKGGEGLNGRDGWDDKAYTIAMMDFDKIEKELEENFEITDGLLGATHVYVMVKEKRPDLFHSKKFTNLEKLVPHLDDENHELQDDSLAITSEVKEDIEEEKNDKSIIKGTGCKICGRKLKGRISMETGIGPECRKTNKKTKAIAA